MKEIFEYFGLTEGAALCDVDAAYDRIRLKYVERVFFKGIEGTRAANALNLLEENYNEIKSYIYNRDFGENNVEIKDMVKAAAATENTQKLQEYLDVILKKDAYWHYIQSIVFYIKKLYFESLNHIKTAALMDKQNIKYEKAVFKLEEKILLKSQEVLSERDGSDESDDD